MKYTANVLFFVGAPGKAGVRPVLDEKDEQILCSYIRCKAKSGRLVSPGWIKRMACHIAKNANKTFKSQAGGPTGSWFYRFRGRHPDVAPFLASNMKTHTKQPTENHDLHSQGQQPTVKEQTVLPTINLLHVKNSAVVTSENLIS